MSDATDESFRPQPASTVALTALALLSFVVIAGLIYALEFRRITAHELVGTYSCTYERSSLRLVIRVDNTYEEMITVPGQRVMKTGAWSYDSAGELTLQDALGFDPGRSNMIFKDPTVWTMAVFPRGLAGTAIIVNEDLGVELR